MEISPYHLFLLLINVFAFGLLLGGLWDFFRLVRILLGESFSFHGYIEGLYEKKIPILKRTLKRSRFLDTKYFFKGVLLFVLDLITLAFAGIGLAILCYHFNQGRFRLFTVLVSFLGFVFYRLTVGGRILFFLEVIAFALHAIFAVAFYVICHPFVIFARIITGILKNIYTKFIFSIAKVKQMLYNKARKKALLKEATHGFSAAFLFC